MPIGYNPDVINPGGIDYAELTDLVNPPNAANAGKAIVIDENGKPTLGEGGGGGGGGAEPVYLYVLDHAIESDDTLPPIPEEFSGYHWEIDENYNAVSLTENGTALKFGELGAIFKQGLPIYVINVAPEIGYGSVIRNIYEVYYAENIYRYNDEENYHVCATFSGGDYSSVGVYANLINW